ELGLARFAELERLRFERHFTLSPALRARTHLCMHDCLLQMNMLISRPQAVPQISSSSSGATLVRIPFGSNLRRPYLLMTADSTRRSWASLAPAIGVSLTV